jgi:hypothetical protein
MSPAAPECGRIDVRGGMVAGRALPDEYFCRGCGAVVWRTGDRGPARKVGDVHRAGVRRRARAALQGASRG